MSLTVNIHEAKTNFSKLLKRTENGEEIVISKAGNPIAKIVPLKNKKIRRFGTAKGKVIIHKDFDDALTDDLMEYFA